MANKAWGEEYRTTIVCVDSYENQIPCGRFYNPHLSEGRMFQSATGFLLKMEQTLDAMEFPKAFTATRSFSTPPKPVEDFPEPDTLTGAKATFAVRILFRQNASWQGSITWLEGRREQSFRSVLELLLLMDSALTTEQPA